MVNIITDSTADLGQKIAADFNLTIVPLSVTLGGNVFRDGVDIRQQELFELVQKHGELPKTAAPTIGEFVTAFDQPGESVFIGISSKLSATIQNALLAASSLPAGKVRVIDSFNLSTGVGLLALRAAELRDQGLSAEQIEKELQSSVPKVRTSFGEARRRISVLRYSASSGEEVCVTKTRPGSRSTRWERKSSSIQWMPFLRVP